MSHGSHPNGRDPFAVEPIAVITANSRTGRCITSRSASYEQGERALIKAIAVAAALCIARMLAIMLPPTLIAQADEVIE